MKRIFATGLVLIGIIGCGPVEQSLPAPPAEPAVSTPIDAFEDTVLNDASEPVFSPDNFVSNVTNPYFNLKTGRKFSYDGINASGARVHRERLATNFEKEIFGVTARALWEREWHDDHLVSDNKKWYAQDKEGNVWLLGEDQGNIFGGFLKDSTSWEAGTSKAKAGIVMPADPNVGDKFKGEFDGSTEGSGEVLGLNQPLSVSGGSYQDCMTIKYETLGQETGAAHSYYCRDLGNEARELTPGSRGKIDLVSIEDNVPIGGMQISYPKLKVSIPEDIASRTALKSVTDGEKVGDISLALKDGKPAYLVEVIKTDGDTKSVYVNITNGSLIK